MSCSILNDLLALKKYHILHLKSNSQSLGNGAGGYSIRPASEKLDVRIPAATDLSR